MKQDEPDFSIIDEDVQFTPLQAIKAIKARIDGEYDNKWLMKLGPLTEDEDRDIRRIIDCTPVNY